MDRAVSGHVRRLGGGVRRQAGWAAGVRHQAGWAAGVRHQAGWAAGVRHRCAIEACAAPPTPGQMAAWLRLGSQSTQTRRRRSGSAPRARTIAAFGFTVHPNAATALTRAARAGRGGALCRFYFIGKRHLCRRRSLAGRDLRPTRINVTAATGAAGLTNPGVCGDHRVGSGAAPGPLRARGRRYLDTPLRPLHPQQPQVPRHPAKAPSSPAASGTSTPPRLGWPRAACAGCC
jgi:hypothetical protein